MYTEMKFLAIETHLKITVQRTEYMELSISKLKNKVGFFPPSKEEKYKVKYIFVRKSTGLNFTIVKAQLVIHMGMFKAL